MVAENETDKAAGAAAEAAERTTDIIEGAQEAAQAAIDEETARRVHAEKVAAEIAAAAMETETGKRVSAIEKDVLSWREKSEAELAATRESLASLSKNQEATAGILSGLTAKLEKPQALSESPSPKENGEKPSSPQSTPHKSPDQPANQSGEAEAAHRAPPARRKIRI